MSLAEQVLRDANILDQAIVSGGYTTARQTQPDLKKYVQLFGAAQANVALNRDVVMHIFSYVDPKTLRSTGSVSKQWKQCTQDSQLWEPITRRENPVFYAQIVSTLESSKHVDWKLTAEAAKNLTAAQAAIDTTLVGQFNTAHKLERQIAIAKLCEDLTFAVAIVIPLSVKMAQLSFRALKFCVAALI